MIASLSVVEGTSATWNEGRLLKMADVVRLTNLHPNTIRRNCEGENPNLPCYRLPSGARRFRLSDVRKFLGENVDSVVDDGQVKQGSSSSIEIAAVVRVSSQKQATARGESDKSSLEHQEQRVAAFIKEKWGNRANVTWFRSCGSGMDFNRPVLHNLILGLIQGKFKILVAQDFTRICRFGVKLIEFLAKLGGCTIIYTMDEEEAEEKGYAEQLTDEILSILTHYTARASAEKSRKVLTVQVSPDVVQEIWKLHQSGYSYRHIANELKRLGKGKGNCGREITKRICERVVKEHGAGLKLLESTTNTNSLASPPNSFVEFMQTRVRLTGQAECRTRQSLLIDKYREWCGQQGKTPMTANSIRKAMKSHFPTVQTRFTDSGTIQYVGLTFTTA